MKSLFLSFILIVSFLSCKKMPSFEEENLDTKIQTVKLPPKPKLSDPNQDEDKDTPSDQKIAVEQKIIKEGSLKFETADLEGTYNQILAVAKNNKGIIQNDSQEKEYSTVSRTIVVRLPNQNFDKFINSISKGMAYFDQKDISLQDVTEQYIDLEARMKAKMKLEERYLELLKKAAKVSEMIEIEAQLSAIREEIESKQGQLKYLQNQVSLSTITIVFYKTVAQQNSTLSYGAKIWNAIASGFQTISEFFLSMLAVWPFLILLATGIYFIKKRFKSKKTH